VQKESRKQRGVLFKIVVAVFKFFLLLISCSETGQCTNTERYVQLREIGRWTNPISFI